MDASAAVAEGSPLPAAAPARPLLRVENLTVRFAGRREPFTAVDQVSLELHRGRTLGIVGESGCGKTTLSRAVLRLIEPTEGRVEFDGIDLATLSRAALRRMRPRMQLIFQDPGGSLNPRLTVEQLVGEALTAHGRARTRSARRTLVIEALQDVGLGEDALPRRPAEFSGGQRQRIVIARAIALRPDLIVCDEPVSALDVSIQSQILNLLSDLQARHGLAYLFIAHNLAVVRRFCEDVAVMQRGRIVERGAADALFRDPRHAYTRTLIAAIPRLPPAPGAAAEK